MKYFNKLFLSLLIFAALGSLFFIKYNSGLDTPEIEKKFRSVSSPKAAQKLKKAREEYFYNMLRDPKTKKIPSNIRRKELVFARKLNTKNKRLNKESDTQELVWKEAGPGNVGGRTRAVVVDKTNPNVIIAGGASGGIWKSTDKGNTWSMKSLNSQILSVTTIVQDPRDGHTNVWYYGTGEVNGSAPDPIKSHKFSGDGIYKSTDNGESWNVLSSTFSGNFTQWDSQFDFVDKIEINPLTGTLFVCAYGIGIFKSTDGGETFSLAFGGTGEHEYSDISIADDGSIAAVFSSPYGSYTSTKPAGVYKSADDGNTWTSVTPSEFPKSLSRSLIEIAPSNSKIAYVVSFVGIDANTQVEDIRFFKVDLSNNSSENRTSNLPVFQFSAANTEERIKTQLGYNLTLAVKPDDENFVLIGATSLFRSVNGFSTKPDNAKMNWIGGYHPAYFSYPNFHPDVHSYCFEPNNPNAVWWGHDGGLSYTSDITQNDYQDVFPWENKNNGYNVTQFYHISISKNANDSRIMGGTQDNGTPFWISNGSVSDMIADVSSGDGYFSYFGESYAYTSVYNGIIKRLGYDGQNFPNGQISLSIISPTGASNQLFLNQYAVDPSNEEIMYYPSGNSLWRNDQLSSIPDFQQGTEAGWKNLENLALPAGYLISAIAVSNSNPSHRLYYGGINFSQQSNAFHKLFRLDNANTAADGAVEISIPDVDRYAYINNISINPENADELIVVFSNYNIAGVYHSVDGGITFNEIEGNLKGDETNPGPSIRSAAILPTSQGKLYLLASSTGIYSTAELNGSNTSWVQEGNNSIGNVVVNHIAARTSDAKIVAGTHGRGAFTTYAEAKPSIPVADIDVSSLKLQSKPGESGNTEFNLRNLGGADLVYDISVTGTFGSALPKVTSANSNKVGPVSEDSPIFENYLKRSKFKQFKLSSEPIMANQLQVSEPGKISGNDYLLIDDGDETADLFGGPGDGQDFNWFNEFDVVGTAFDLENIDLHIRTEESKYNLLYIAVHDKDQKLLSFGYVSLDVSKEGQWFSVPVMPKLSFNDGDKFYIELLSYSFIPEPAGIDLDAQIPNKSYFFDYASIAFVNLNTQPGFENGAFLIRAKGTKHDGSGGGNQNPVAVVSVSKTQAGVNETIIFDASQSTDSDGEISQYLWDFGDGSTSNQVTVGHAYSQPNTYNISLTVTDNQGGTGQASGQIIVGSGETDLVTADPSSGTISPGETQLINLSLNAQNLGEGIYTGQVNIATNVGNIILPIDYLVDVKKISSVPDKFDLSQNYPNPFNPSTTIEYTLPLQSEYGFNDVKLIVYDLTGRKVMTLVDEKQSQGKYKVHFDASELSSGIYFYRLEAGNFQRSKKMLFLK